MHSFLYGNKFLNRCSGLSPQYSTVMLVLLMHWSETLSWSSTCSIYPLVNTVTPFHQSFSLLPGGLSLTYFLVFTIQCAPSFLHYFLVQRPPPFHDISGLLTERPIRLCIQAGILQTFSALSVGFQAILAVSSILCAFYCAGTEFKDRFWKLWIFQGKYFLKKLSNPPCCPFGHIGAEVWSW